MKGQSTLELFILSCVDRGIATPYDLQRQAGLSLGATNPALKRLVKSGLLKRTTGKSPTRRPRHEYALTAEGKKAARTGWKQYLTDANTPTDIESMLRIFDLASYYKASEKSLADFLGAGISQRSNALEHLLLTDKQQRLSSSQPQYVRLRAKLERIRYKAEIDLLGDALTPLKMTTSKKIPHSPNQQMLQIPPR